DGATALVQFMGSLPPEDRHRAPGVPPKRGSKLAARYYPLLAGKEAVAPTPHSDSLFQESDFSAGREVPTEKADS
ncbi:MAG TPA: hypothetical protein VLO07_09750, partial [Thermoanaerobaculia bacterium]|nr:hypothetical protein [Thermoanaerobaculia bacterium]